MYSAEEQVYNCIKTWNDILELGLELDKIFAFEVSHIMVKYWPLITEENIKDSLSRKSYLIQIIQTLALVVEHKPSSIPSHWTQKNLDEINFLNKNRDRIMP